MLSLALSIAMLLFAVLLFGRIYNKGLFYCSHDTVNDYKSYSLPLCVSLASEGAAASAQEGGDYCLRSIDTLRVSLRHESAGSDAFHFVYISMDPAIFVSSITSPHALALSIQRIQTIIPCNSQYLTQVNISHQ